MCGEEDPRGRTKKDLRAGDIRLSESIEKRRSARRVSQGGVLRSVRSRFTGRSPGPTRCFSRGPARNSDGGELSEAYHSDPLSE